MYPSNHSHHNDESQHEEGVVNREQEVRTATQHQLVQPQTCQDEHVRGVCRERTAGREGGRREGGGERREEGGREKGGAHRGREEGGREKGGGREGGGRREGEGRREEGAHYSSATVTILQHQPIEATVYILILVGWLAILKYMYHYIS